MGAHCISSTNTSGKPPLKQKLKSICKGAAVGSACTGCVVITLNILQPLFHKTGMSGVMRSLSQLPVSALVFFILGYIVWFLCLCLLALPFWLALEKFSITSKRAAALLGAGLSGGMTLLLWGGDVRSASAALMLLTLTGSGALVGRYIWCDAYQIRKTAKPS